jgi:integrase
MALKVFFRDFLKAPEVMASFKFPHQIFKPKQILGKQQLVQFYRSLETAKEKALFMLYATTGLRRDEILSLKSENIDFSRRMIIPNNHSGETKKSWVSFYNQEAEQVLKEHLATKKLQEVKDFSRCNETKLLSYGSLLDKRQASILLLRSYGNGSVQKCSD